MKKVTIKCMELVLKYNLDVLAIEVQLATMKHEPDATDFVVAYIPDAHYTFLGEIYEDEVILWVIIKANSFIKMDNSDLLKDM